MLVSLLNIFTLVFISPIRPQVILEGEASEITDTCYPLVGCFSNFPPWISNSRPIFPPQHPINISTTVKLYNRKNPNGIEFSVYPELHYQKLSENHSTFIVYHGYASNISEPWIKKLTTALLNRTDSYVFLPEYKHLVRFPLEQAVGDIRVIAKLSALLIQAIGVDNRNVHLIGHGIGAHIASYVADALPHSGKKIGRITGLDPAGLFYEGEPTKVRLDKGDALFVDVWHTNAGGLGIFTPCGHVDYYINGGLEQLNCKNHSKPNMCSHEIVHDIFIEALKDDCLLGQKSVFTSGNEFNTSAVFINQTDNFPINFQKNIPAGVYYVPTNLMSPFCIDLNEFELF